MKKNTELTTVETIFHTIFLLIGVIIFALLVGSLTGGCTSQADYDAIEANDIARNKVLLVAEQALIEGDYDVAIKFLNQAVAMSEGSFKHRIEALVYRAQVKKRKAAQ